MERLHRHTATGMLAAGILATLGAPDITGDVSYPGWASPYGGHPGHTRGSSRDVEHERHRNRLARKARRVERLHRHTATGRKLMAKVSGAEHSTERIERYH